MGYCRVGDYPIVLIILKTSDVEPNQQVCFYFQSDDESNDFARIPTPENPLTLQGHEGVEEERPYNGAPFPPQHPPLPSNVPWGAWEADTRREETIQQRAMDWWEVTVA